MDKKESILEPGYRAHFIAVTEAAYASYNITWMRYSYLDVSVDAPRRRFAVVDRLDGGLSDSGQVSAAKQPRNAGLHRHRIYARQVVVIQLQRTQSLDDCNTSCPE